MIKLFYDIFIANIEVSYSIYNLYFIVFFFTVFYYIHRNYPTYVPEIYDIAFSDLKKIRI